jgi:hypothetical protein
MSLKHLTFDPSGTVLFGDMTGAYQTALGLTDDLDILFVFNTTDQPLWLRLPSGRATQELRVPNNSSFVIDCRTNSKRIAKGLIEVKHTGVVPTLGEFTVYAAR